RAGYRPRHAGAVEPELMVAGRLQVSGGPPWSPAPKPPGLADYGTMPWLALPGQVPGNGSVSRAIPPGPRPSPYSRSTFCATDMTGPGPGHLSSAQIAAPSAASGIRAGAHRRVRRRGPPRAGPASSKEQHEVSLRAERPVVEKEAVPVERVRLGTETVTEQHPRRGRCRAALAIAGLDQLHIAQNVVNAILYAVLAGI